VSQRTRVLLLLHGLSRTGAPRVALDALEAMNREVDAFVIAADGGPLEEDFGKIGPLHILAEKWPKGRIWQRLPRRFEWGRWVRSIHRWAPDVIYVNSVAALPILKMVPLPEAPVLLHVHELHSELVPILHGYPELLRSRPARYLAVSGAVFQALVSECGIREDRISLVHEFIPESRLDGEAKTRPGRAGDGSFVVGGAGVPGWRKGSILWLQMVAEVRKLLGPSARFVWVGIPEWPGPSWLDGLKFRREVQLLGLDGVVELVPSTPKALEHFASFDVFAMTSWEDPCPLVVLENMGLGTPVVCFEGGGGSSEAVGDTGVIIPEFDPLAMARAIADLAANPAARARLGGLARQRMLANFTDRVQVPKIRREILAAISGKQSPAADPMARQAPERGPGAASDHDVHGG
jgi:glycosyltransferase involved in cell wall biosynthesis